MLVLLSEIVITQVPTTDFKDRNSSFTMNFVTECELSSSWANLTDTAKLKFPKNIYFSDQTGKQVSWEGKNIAGSSTTPPLVMRGDKITISLGYQYPVANPNPNAVDTLVQEMNTEFTGYITKITPSMPIEMECEDNMYRLKQVQAPNKQYNGSVQDMLKDMFANAKIADITINSDSTISLGKSFTTNSETIAQVLNRLQKDYQIESYFRGNELRCSDIVYYGDAIQSVFAFQENIIKDDLEYRRLDDFKMGITAKSVSEVQSATSTRKDGTPKMDKQQLSVFVTKDVKGNIITPAEGSFEGENRSLYFFSVTNLSDLTKKAGNKLNRLYYEGFYGSFTSFGLPFVKHGDDVLIRDRVLPERNGTYKAKKVTVTFGEKGFRRKIDLDIRVDTIPKDQLTSTGQFIG